MKLYDALTVKELETLPGYDWKLESPAVVRIWSRATGASATGRTLCEAYRALGARR